MAETGRLQRVDVVAFSPNKAFWACHFLKPSAASAAARSKTMIVMEAFGRGLVVEPFFATVILAGGLLRRAGDPTLIGALIPRITAGKLKLAFGHVERHSRYDLANVATTARKSWF